MLNNNNNNNSKNNYNIIITGNKNNFFFYFLLIKFIQMYEINIKILYIFTIILLKNRFIIFIFFNHIFFLSN